MNNLKFFLLGFLTATVLFTFIKKTEKPIQVQVENSGPKSPLFQVGDCFDLYNNVNDEFKTPEVYEKVKIIKVGEKSYLIKLLKSQSQLEMSSPFSYIEDPKHAKKTNCE